MENQRAQDWNVGRVVNACSRTSGTDFGSSSRGNLLIFGWEEEEGEEREEGSIAM